MTHKDIRLMGVFTAMGCRVNGGGFNRILVITFTGKLFVVTHDSIIDVAKETVYAIEAKTEDRDWHYNIFEKGAAYNSATYCEYLGTWVQGNRMDQLTLGWLVD